MPDYVVEGTKFYGIRGNFSTETQPNATTTENTVNGIPINVTVDNTNSETVFNFLSSTTNACPSEAEEADGYNVIESKYGSMYSYNTTIVKQTLGGRQSVNYDYKLPDGIPMKFGKGRCLFLSMDGADFTGYNYTIKADLDLIVRVPNPKPVKIYTLDGEFVTLRGVPYVVYPVTKDGANGTVQEGTLTGVYGDASMLNQFAILHNWKGLNQIAVYKNDSCQAAFPNHLATRFNWQYTPDSMRGFGYSIAWLTSIIISEMTLSGDGRGTDMKQMTGNNQLPIHLEAGDCVVHAITNSYVNQEGHYVEQGDWDPTQSKWDENIVFNQEMQTHFTIIPD